MPQSRTTALTIATEPAKARTESVLRSATHALGYLGNWAARTSQQFGSLVSTLMAPAVFCVYTFAAWSLAANLGWTASFPYSTGPLSNWLIWAGFAIAVHVAAQVLRRHTRTEGSSQK